MALSDAIELMLIHNDWANRQILEACRALTPEQFHRRFAMGPGSLHDTMTHVFEAMGIWSDNLAGRERRQWAKQLRAVDELLVMQELTSAEFGALARAGGAADPISATRLGKTYVFPRAGIVTHVATHGMHHRAQCLNMLRQVGVEKLPPSSVVEWMRDKDQAG